MTADLPWTRDISRHPMVPPDVKRIATLVFGRIASDQYSFGTRIPAERDLADEFRSTRATVRQALSFLAGYDIVSRRQGSGTFVAYRPPAPEPEIGPVAQASAMPEPVRDGAPDIALLAETSSPFAICIAGSVLEPELVRLATIYMTTRDLTELRGLLAEIEAIVTEADRFAALEDAFMMRLARGTHNGLLVAMYGVLNQVRRHPLSAPPRRRALTPAKIRKNQQLLRSLFEAIEARNVETAVELITLHVSTTHEEMIYESQ